MIKIVLGLVRDLYFNLCIITIMTIRKTIDAENIEMLDSIIETCDNLIEIDRLIQRREDQPLKFNIELVQDNITNMKVDAIVNAAHEGLSGGGGVDGAIHRVAGAQLAGECINQLYGCPVGYARITNGYNLTANYVIHTVAPVWRGGKFNEFNELRQCYSSCLNLASMQGLKSIAFPCLGTGAFCMPKKESAVEALDVVRSYFENVIESYGKSLDNHPIWMQCETSLESVKFVCFNPEDYQCYLDLLPNGVLEIR